MSRPSSQKSGAWSKDDPEAGQRRASTAKTSKTKKTTFEEILEEELAADEYKGQEHVGCWTRITSTLSRKLIPIQIEFSMINLIFYFVFRNLVNHGFVNS